MGWFKKERKRWIKYVLGHALAFGICGLVIFTLSYQYILSKRVQFGYFDFPWLTTLSELNWYFIGSSFVLIATGLAGGYVGHRRHKRKKR